MIWLIVIKKFYNEGNKMPNTLNLKTTTLFSIGNDLYQYPNHIAYRVVLKTMRKEILSKFSDDNDDEMLEYLLIKHELINWLLSSVLYNTGYNTEYNENEVVKGINKC